MFDLAIEVGAYFTKIYKKGEGIILKEPSLIAVTKNGESYDIKAMGVLAKKMQGKTDENTTIFSPIGEGEIKSIPYATAMLKYFLTKLNYKSSRFSKSILCVPCGISEDERKNYLELARECGVKNVSLVPSIVCASVESVTSISTPRSTFMVDIGGGSTDIAIINMNDIIKGCTIGVGGRQMDVEIAAVVADKYQTIISIASAQKIKEEIGSLYSSDNSNYEVVGNDEESNYPRKVIVSAGDVKEAILPYFEQIVIAVQTTINLSAPEISNDIIKDGIVLSGGVCAVSGLEKYLRNKLKLPVKIVDNYENASILGAGKLLSDERTLESIIDNY